MAYQGITNETPYYAEPQLLQDEEGRDVLVVYVKAAYAIQPEGQLVLAENQIPVNPAGEYFGEPGKSSLKYAPECAFAKLATDVILIGHAYAPEQVPVTQLDVSLRVGALQKSVRVFGDRVWEKGFFGWRISDPQSLTTMPLIYERAFGGKDVSHEDAKNHEYELRNPLGVGLMARKTALNAPLPLPNLEDPKNLIQKITDRPPPAGFGCIAPDWHPRLPLAGTYDEAWQQQRMPLLAKDFNRAFFNAAGLDLIAPAFLTGSEDIEVINATPQGRLAFRLPGQAPRVFLTMSGEDEQDLPVTLDTVTINTDESVLVLLWRASASVFQRIYDMERIRITADAQASLNQRAA